MCTCTKRACLTTQPSATLTWAQVTNHPWVPLEATAAPCFSQPCAAEVLRSQPYNEKCDVYSYGEQQRMPMPEWLGDRQQPSMRKVDRRQQQRMLKANSSTFRAAQHRMVVCWRGCTQIYAAGQPVSSCCAMPPASLPSTTPAVSCSSVWQTCCAP